MFIDVFVIVCYVPVCIHVCPFPQCTLRLFIGQEGEGSESGYLVGAQRDPSPAAGAELGLAIGTDMATAVGKLGFVADAAGGRVSLRLRRGFGLIPDLLHLVLVHFKLLVQLPVGGRGER